MTDHEQSQLRQSLREQFHKMMVEPLTVDQPEPATDAQWRGGSSKR